MWEYAVSPVLILLMRAVLYAETTGQRTHSACTESSVYCCLIKALTTTETVFLP